MVLALVVSTLYPFLQISRLISVLSCELGVLSEVAAEDTVAETSVVAATAVAVEEVIPSTESESVLVVVMLLSLSLVTVVSVLPPSVELAWVVAVVLRSFLGVVRLLVLFACISTEVVAVVAVVVVVAEVAVTHSSSGRKRVDQ